MLTDQRSFENGRRLVGGPCFYPGGYVIIYEKNSLWFVVQVVVVVVHRCVVCRSR